MPDKLTQTELATEAFTGLLTAFRSGRTGHPSEERPLLERYLSALSTQWDERYPGFPETPACHASLLGVARRGIRDGYLKELIVRELESAHTDLKAQTIVNPVCVFGRHARDLASRLPGPVIGTDISGLCNRLYHHVRLGKTPKNYRFVQDDIFEPKLDVQVSAVVFFGACGSLSDAAMDYAVQSDAQHILCRTCCHDNIGGNTVIVKRPSTLNRLFRIKNLIHQTWTRHVPGHYFSGRYTRHDYPRSQTARQLADDAEFLNVCRHSVDSDICRALIDLDRVLYLIQKGYQVWTKGELLAACKKV
jgi:hypothetical protein